MEESDTRGTLTGEIQGNVLRGYRPRSARFVHLEIQSAQEGREWLEALPVTSGAPKDRPECALTVAFSRSGLEALGVRRELILEFPEAFRVGMSKRSKELGDHEDQSGWDEVFQDARRLHALVGLFGSSSDEGVVDEHLERVTKHPGVEVLATQNAGDLGGREHFGFRDGISQPIQADGEDGWKSDVAIREFLLFESNWNEGNGSKLGIQLSRLGTFLAYRKLEQHVTAFRAFLQGWPGGMSPDHVAAKVMGRFANGSPVTNDPQAPNPPDDDSNEFDYSDDDREIDCPYGAHISRANPRSRTQTDVSARRILRRGLPYGAPQAEIVPGTPFTAPVPENDFQKRGLVFVALNSSIEKQFEFVQRYWINQKDFNGLDGVDPIAHTKVGDDMGMFRLRRTSGPRRRLEDFVTLRGGEYFFLPSMKAVKDLAEGVFT
jgi:Dyp-type peroxidase family